MKNGDIPNENIKASSQLTNMFGGKHHAYHGRLHADFERWTAKLNDQRPWIQADIGYPTNITGVVTQGDGFSYLPAAVWVTSFKVSTFAQSTSDEEVFIKNKNGTDMVST